MDCFTESSTVDFDEIFFQSSGGGGHAIADTGNVSGIEPFIKSCAKISSRVNLHSGSFLSKLCIKFLASSLIIT
jgi:hypothetical protein